MRYKNNLEKRKLEDEKNDFEFFILKFLILNFNFF